MCYNILNTFNLKGVSLHKKLLFVFIGFILYTLHRKGAAAVVLSVKVVFF